MTDSDRADPPLRVAVIGGGCAGMSAAFELTRPEQHGRFEVTVFQQGWRLGGKGASGRGPAARIEEHGLHIWMGFYENAFRLMRECYAELGRDPARCPIARWDDAFFPDPGVGVVDRDPHGRWSGWSAHFPPVSGLPGDPMTGRSPFTIQAYLERSIELLFTLIDAIQVRGGGAPTATGAAPAPADLQRDALRWLKIGQIAGLTALLEGARLLRGLVGLAPGADDGVALRFVDAIANGVRGQLEALTHGDDESRRLHEVIDLLLASIRGILRFGLVTDPRGFEAIDDWDCREWLRLNGASEAALDSAVLRGIYDLVFAYERGDETRPRIAAGQAMRGAVRMFFTYRGSLFWKMRAGMGDVVFAPFYEALQRRGVRFAFFHRLENLTLSGGPDPHVRELVFDVQAKVRGGGEYAPLVDVAGLPCWPSEPDWAQLEDGEAERAAGRDFECWWDTARVEERRLRVGADFDLVVLAVGVGVVPHLARELVERVPAWRRAVEHMHSVPTQAFQVWLREDMAALGWGGEQVNLAGYVKPFDTWADMRQLIPEERFPTQPGAIAYFCSVLHEDEPMPGREDAGYPARQRERVRRHAIEHLEKHVATLWPRARAEDGGFRWELLVDPEGRHGERDPARFDTQFWSTNVNPTDRYALALPGTLRHRLSPLDRSVDNLTVAGDWTDAGFNEGCVEAAVMSGRLAAHALSGAPALADIVGFDHP